jgi:hypothetical protein
MLKKTLLAISCLLLAMCIAFSQKEVKKEIEITTVKINQTTKAGERIKLTSSISFTGKSTLQEETILESYLMIELFSLQGQKQFKIDTRFCFVEEGRKFTETFTTKDRLLPPAKYLVVTLPSGRQMIEDLIFSEERQKSLTVQYYFTIGTPQEKLWLSEKEFSILTHYIQAAKSLLKSIEEVVAKSKTEKKLPDNNDSFRKWLTQRQQETYLIGTGIDAFPDGTILTYYPLTYDKLQEIRQGLINNFNAIERTMQYAGEDKASQNGDEPDPVSPVLFVDMSILKLIEDAEELISKEIIFDLSAFLYWCQERISDDYRAISQKPNKLDLWKTQEKLYQQWLDEYDQFVADYTPPVEKLWQEYTSQLTAQEQIILEQLDLYRQVIEGKSAPDNLEPLKLKLKEIYDSIYEALKIRPPPPPPEEE